jgi:hypothetical protein
LENKKTKFESLVRKKESSPKRVSTVGLQNRNVKKAEFNLAAIGSAHDKAGIKYSY